ncbi:hypothetical protein, partial [Nocardiopsis exhalans]|uniref:hypothetical protein n=1 Tax=Nocardiopsis exhalans TaxID=163604 RepID=UPI0031D13FC2
MSDADLYVVDQYRPVMRLAGTIDPNTVRRRGQSMFTTRATRAHGRDSNRWPLALPTEFTGRGTASIAVVPVPGAIGVFPR